MTGIEDLRKKSTEELRKELANIQKELQKTVSDIMQKKEKNVKKASFLRKDIARIKTLLNEKLREEKNEY
ncbi:MAG TPA: 50S ribosomal protein L29 [bacterium]|jgi:large subunit ribosomal protein L29|nr:50S ribosomal protein L29 [bacterium]